METPFEMHSGTPSSRRERGFGGDGFALTFTHGPSGGYYPYLDAVVLDVTLPAGGPDGDVPEPGTMCALGLAVCGLGGYVRRRRKA